MSVLVRQRVSHCAHRGASYDRPHGHGSSHSRGRGANAVNSRCLVLAIARVVVVVCCSLLARCCSCCCCSLDSQSLVPRTTCHADTRSCVCVRVSVSKAFFVLVSLVLISRVSLSRSTQDGQRQQHHSHGRLGVRHHNRHMEPVSHSSQTRGGLPTEVGQAIPTTPSWRHSHRCHSVRAIAWRYLARLLDGNHPLTHTHTHTLSLSLTSCCTIDLVIGCALMLTWRSMAQERRAHRVRH